MNAEVTEDPPEKLPFCVRTAIHSELEDLLCELAADGWQIAQVFLHQGLAAAHTKDGITFQVFTVLAIPKPPQPTPEQMKEMADRVAAQQGSGKRGPRLVQVPDPALPTD